MSRCVDSDLKDIVLWLPPDELQDDDEKNLEKWNVPQVTETVTLTNLWGRLEAAGVSVGQISFEAFRRLDVTIKHQKRLITGFQNESGYLRLLLQEQKEAIESSENVAERLRDEIQEMALLMAMFNENSDKKAEELKSKIQEQSDELRDLRTNSTETNTPSNEGITTILEKELARKLQTKDMLLELIQKKVQADKLQFLEKHRTESDELKRKARAAEALVQRFKTALTAFRISLEDIESMECPCKKGVSETRSRSVERTSLAETGQQEDRELPAISENNTEPEVRRKVDPNKQEVGSKRKRDGRQNAAPKALGPERVYPSIAGTRTFPMANETKKLSEN